jgi:uncharacterized protein
VLIPLFPLPNVVLFPGVYLPLHIFEPRYRAMVGDALETDRQIGMVLLKPGYESDYEGRPPIFSIGCAGVITYHERLRDGRYHIVLQGTERFRIEREDPSRAYRLADVEALAEGTEDPLELHSVRQRLEALIAKVTDRKHRELSVPASMSDVDLVHALAQYLDLAPLEKQALLELEGVMKRATALADLIEISSLPHGFTGTAH